MTYRQHLDQLRALSQSELDCREAELRLNLPNRLFPWPVGMPASLDPKLVLIGASPGNSPVAGDEGAAHGFTSAPTSLVTKNSHYYYPDGTRYTEKIRYFAHTFCLTEGTVTIERDALSLCTHFNLGTGRAGEATTDVVEPDVISWVSRLLNQTLRPDLVVLFGLFGILSNRQIARYWNCDGGLRVDWNACPLEKTFSGYHYKFREWNVINALNHELRVVMWPNHPSKHPFADMNVWKRSVEEYLGLRKAVATDAPAPIVRRTIRIKPVDRYPSTPDNDRMRTDSTRGHGNLGKASSGTSRFMVRFRLTKGDKTETRERAWRAPTKQMAMNRVQNHYQKEGYACTPLSADEIAGSYKK